VSATNAAVDARKSDLMDMEPPRVRERRFPIAAAAILSATAAASRCIWLANSGVSEHQAADNPKSARCVET
jgi:hypothetical protein